MMTTFDNSRHATSVALASCLFLTFIRLVPAAELAGDRPTFSAGPATVPVGNVQLEAGYVFSDLGASNEHLLGEILARVGYRETVELRLGLDGYSWSDGPGPDASGFGDGSIGLKWTLGQSDVFGGTDMGLLLTSTVPIGNNDIGASGWQPTAILALGWQLSAAVSLGSNFGYTYAKDSSDRFSQVFGSASLGINAGEAVDFFLETYAFNRESKGRSTAVYFDAGAIVGLSDRYLIDARVGFGFEDSETDFFAGIGFVTYW